GQSAKRQLITRVAANATAGMMLTNTAKVTASNAAEVDMSRSIPVDPTRALALTIVEAAAPAVPGESLTYIVTFANRSHSADAGVMLRGAVPAGTQFVSATQGGTEQAGVGTWSLGTVGGDQSGERRFTVTVTATNGAIFSDAGLSDAQRPGTIRVRAEAATPGQAAPPLALDMTLTPDPVQPGELLRVDLTVRNRSQITLTDAMLLDQTLDGTAIVSIDGGICPFNNCAIVNTTVSWTLGMLAPGQSLTRQLILRAGAMAQAGTLLLNTAHVTATGAPEGHAVRAVPVDPARAVAVSIAEESEPAVPGESLTYIVTFANHGNMAEPDVVMQAVVPDGTQFVSATVDGVVRDGMVIWALGTVGVGQN